MNKYKTSVLNLIFQQANVAGVLICRNEDLRSAVVVGLPHNSLKNLASLGSNEFPADGPDWHLGVKDCVWNLTFTRCMR